jgi:hypothetical protein
MSGKGSKPRPLSVTREQFANSFELIFGKKEKLNVEQPNDNKDGQTEARAVEPKSTDRNS